MSSRLIFPQWTETFKKWVNLLVLGAPVYLVALIAYGVTPEALRIGYQPEQPVPYSHALHAGELGMDCRYCHSTVERAAKAAVPPAATCMNCHQTVHPKSEKLLPIREAYAGAGDVRWTRVHDLPDYVYFNHSAHVSIGVGCESCHGRIDQMVKVYQYAPLTMQWCLECHRAVGDATAAGTTPPYLRPPSKVTEMGYKRTPADLKDIAKNVRPPTNCSTCHR
jgi:hypothetical protein